MSGDTRGDVEARVLEELASIPSGLTMEELAERLGWRGDLRPLRRIVAEMVRRGIVVKVPDYDRRRIVFKVHRGSGPS
ncbi:MAG: MarR family transcriptional regulator [Aeropyrum sp.]|nr:MarR family transcriptional regulator [Aeropyrum sp.]MCE4616158.1 MarR family transcriptional regulator [Aeropyrum sp.]